MFERPCPACCIFTRVDVFERAPGPFGEELQCPACADRSAARERVRALMAERERVAESERGEPECSCRLFCNRCL